MEKFLDVWLPDFLPDCVTWSTYAYQGKLALLRKIEDRLRGYATWLGSDTRIVIVVDRDGDDCEGLKRKLEEICDRVGLRTRRGVGHCDWQVATRIAIEELEAWYFGDWHAVHAAYPRVSPNVPKQARYRKPDAIQGGTWEAFERILQKSGYFSGGLAKMQAAAAIGERIDPARNRSPSFKAFRDAIAEAAATD